MEIEKNIYTQVKWRCKCNEIFHRQNSKNKSIITLKKKKGDFFRRRRLERYNFDTSKVDNTKKEQ